MAIRKINGNKKRQLVPKQDVNTLSNEEFFAQVDAACRETTNAPDEVDINVSSDEGTVAALEDRITPEEDAESLSKNESFSSQTTGSTYSYDHTKRLYFTFDIFGRPIAARRLSGSPLIITHIAKTASSIPFQIMPLIRDATPAELADPMLFPPMVSIGNGLMSIDDLPSCSTFFQRADAHGTLWATWDTLLAEARVGCDVGWHEWVMAFSSPREQSDVFCDAQRAQRAQRLVDGLALELEELRGARWLPHSSSAAALNEEAITHKVDYRNACAGDADREKQYDHNVDDEDAGETDDDDDDDDEYDTVSDDSEWSDVDDAMDEPVFETMLRDAHAALALLKNVRRRGGVVDQKMLATMLRDACAAAANTPSSSSSSGPQRSKSRHPLRGYLDENVATFLSDLAGAAGAGTASGSGKDQEKVQD
ncbi:hypothetical protein IWZ03DRAFT_412859 [Phyllosticta citriasiana]|uniref:Uncharacterized protein n=1 Tax=Phyllosticta citriasiana TaxID=595635 RepID=A0ABR1KRA0_9PEZI